MILAPVYKSNPIIYVMLSATVGKLTLDEWPLPTPQPILEHIWHGIISGNVCKQ